MKTRYRLRIDSQVGDHVHFTIFAGPADGTSQNTGSLCMSPQQYQLFAAMLHLGATNPRASEEVIIQSDSLE